MAQEPELSYLQERLCFALYSASKAIVGKYQPFLSELNMTYPQYLVYLVLDEEGSMTVSHLGSLLYLDSGTLTPVLKRMEAAGLVVRNRDREDERRVIVSLTEQAGSIRDEIARMQKSLSCATGLSSDEFVALRDQVKSLNEHLRSS